MIAKEIELEDPYENMGAKTSSRVATRQMNGGHGTTTAQISPKQ